MLSDREPSEINKSYDTLRTEANAWAKSVGDANDGGADTADADAAAPHEKEKSDWFTRAVKESEKHL